MTRREYGSGSVYFRKSDARWVGTIEAGWTRTGARRRITVTGKTEAEAKRKLRDKRAKIEREGQMSGSQRKTVKAWAEEWLEIRAAIDRPKTHTTDRGAVSAWIVPTIGHKRLDQLTPADRRAVANAVRKAGKTASTARRYDGTLTRLLKAAIVEGYNVPARVLAIEPPAANPNDRQALELDEAKAALRAAAQLPRGDLRWAMGLVQGMRRGEVLGLTWPEVDLDAGWIAVSWQLQALPYLDPKDRSKGFRIPDDYEARRLEGAWHLVRPKSKAGWRVIPLVPAIRLALTNWQQMCPTSPHGLVFPTDDGRPRDTKDDFAEWCAIQTAAGVEHPSGRPYTVHELRNTTATMLLDLEVPESVRIAIMGHSNIAVTRGYETVSRNLALDALTKVSDRLQLGM